MAIRRQIPIPSLPQPLTIGTLLSVSMNLTSLVISFKRTIRYLSFCDCLISLNIMSSNLICIVAYDQILFSFLFLSCLFFFESMFMKAEDSKTKEGLRAEEATGELRRRSALAP